MGLLIFSWRNSTERKLNPGASIQLRKIFTRGPVLRWSLQKRKGFDHQRRWEKYFQGKERIWPKPKGADRNGLAREREQMLWSTEK